MSKAIDDKLISMLKLLTIASRLRTCLDIRLADYASQTLGYRSTRHVRGDERDAVEDVFEDLINTLHYISNECITIISREHTYKPTILQMDEYQLELLLETTLYECVVYDTTKIFCETFLD